jgi:hypothetical protein
MSKIALRPFLIVKEADGQYRLSVRETRYNSQGYPLTKVTPHGDTFASLSAARAFASANFGAKAGEFATS